MNNEFNRRMNESSKSDIDSKLSAIKAITNLIEMNNCKNVHDVMKCIEQYKDVIQIQLKAINDVK
jgi:hypothetical protein